MSVFVITDQFKDDSEVRRAPMDYITAMQPSSEIMYGIQTLPGNTDNRSN